MRKTKRKRNKGWRCALAVQKALRVGVFMPSLLFGLERWLPAIP